MKRVPKVSGYTGLQFSNNTLIDQEIQANLRFPKSIHTYSLMQSDPIVSGSLFMIQQFIRKARIYAAPKGGLEATPLAKQRAEQIRKALFEDMNRSFDLVLTDILSFVRNGFSLAEPCYKIKDGMITWKDFSTRSVNTIKGFEWEDINTGEIKNVVQFAPINTPSGFARSETEIKIPYKRLLHFRTNAEGNDPYGRSILKNAYRSWFYKSNLEEKEAVGVERYLGGIPKITMPIAYFNADENSEDETEVALAAVRTEMFKQAANLRNNSQTFVGLPSDTEENGKALFTFDLIKSDSGSNAPDTNKIIERYDYRIAQSMLTDFLLMGSSSTGSFALSDNKVSTFLQSLESYLEVICNEINRKAIPELFERNGWSLADLPELKYKPISSISASELGNFLDKTKNFLTSDKTLENAIRDEVGLPPRDEASLYIDKPTTAHQAESQRIAMEASAADAGSEETSDKESEDVDNKDQETNSEE